MISETQIYCSLCETLSFDFKPESLEDFYLVHSHTAPHKLGKVYPWIKESEGVDPLNSFNGRCAEQGKTVKSDKTLKRWYRIINKRFFGNQLTNKVCVRWSNEEDNDEEDRCEEKAFGWADRANDRYHEYVIVLSRININSKSTKLLTLAHEMCHLGSALKDNHGPAFESWRQYIADRGIFKKSALIKGLTIF